MMSTWKNTIKLPQEVKTNKVGNEKEEEVYWSHSGEMYKIKAAKSRKKYSTVQELY